MKAPAWPFLSALALVACAPGPRTDVAAGFRGRIDSLPAAWKGEPVVALCDSVRLELFRTDGGNAAERRQVTWLYVNRRDPALLERIVGSDYENIERPLDLRVTAFYPDGQRWALEPWQAHRERDSQGEFPESNHFLTVAELPRYLEGTLLRVEEVRHFTRPEFLSAELLRTEWPCLAKSVRVSVPAGSDIRPGLADPEGLSVDTVREAGPQAAVFSVSAARLAKLDVRTMPREPEAWYAAVRFAFPPKGPRSPTWAELGDAYLASIAEAMRPTPEIERLAAGLKAPADSLPVAVLAALRVRIRYHAEIDKLHAFVPRSAGEVLAKGYGDCKEMSTLMAVILRLKGVPAGVALVSPPGRLQPTPAFPGLGEFSHMIVYVPGRDGAPRFFDPTVGFGSPADSHMPLLDRSALVLRPGASALERVGAAQDRRNRVETQASIVPGPGKEWRLEGSIRLDGASAMLLHPFLAACKGDESQAFLRNYLETSFGVLPTACKASVVPDRTPILIEYQAPFTANYLSLDKGGLLVNQPSLYGGETRYTTLDLEGPRHFHAVDQVDTWRVPAGFPELKADPLDHDLCQGSWRREGTALVRRYACRDADIAPRDRRVAEEFNQRKRRFARATLWR
jgi:transglutaminase-like putative cysteine protease